MPMVPDNGPYGFEKDAIAAERSKRLLKHTTEYLVFEQINSTTKTHVWTVSSHTRGDILGMISWWGPWRQYVFKPAPNTVFNTGCLSDIETYLDDAMVDWREQRARTNAQGTATAGR